MIELVEHQREWTDAFRRASTSITIVLGGRIDRIEHIGSTAVPSLLAKPIIDLAARATEGTDPFGLAGPLAGLGFEMHAAGPKNHAVYVRVVGDCRTHLLHVFASEQWESCNHRLFRDKLLHDEDARHRYRALKQTLASSTDGRAYTAGKSRLIEELLNEERKSRGLPPTTAWDK